MSAIAELTIFPVDQGQSLSAPVARALTIIRESGLAYQLGPMGTCIEGETAPVFDCARRCLEELSAGGQRVYLVMKVDYRPGRVDGIHGKVASVTKKLKKTPA